MRQKFVLLVHGPKARLEKPCGLSMNHGRSAAILAAAVTQGHLDNAAGETPARHRFVVPMCGRGTWLAFHDFAFS